MRGISFEPVHHEYKSIGEMPVIDWVSGTKFVSSFHEEFDSKSISEKSSRGRGKWHGISPSKIMSIWEEEKNRAVKLGNWYHNQREQELLSFKDFNNMVVYPSKYEGGLKVEYSPILRDGIYPELMVYLESEGICGQSDLVEVKDGYVHVKDYKTSKTIDFSSYVSWDGKSKKMFKPISHLDDVNGVHYALQLSLYMYIILRHNPKLKPGNIELHHAIFKKVSENDYGYPVYEKDVTGDGAKIEDLKIIQVPYYEKEIKAMLKHFNKNR